MKTQISILVVLCFSLVSCDSSKNHTDGETESADQARFEGVHKIAALVEEYHDKTGRYPGEGFDVSGRGVLYVHITKQKLQGDDRFPPHGVTGLACDERGLLDDMRQVLGRKIDFPSDPRPVTPESRHITYYRYVWDGKYYFVTVNMEHEYEQTRTIGPGCYKYEVSSLSIPKKKIRKFKEIDPNEKLLPLTQ